MFPIPLPPQAEAALLICQCCQTRYDAKDIHLLNANAQHPTPHEHVLHFYQQCRECGMGKRLCFTFTTRSTHGNTRIECNAQSILVDYSFQEMESLAKTEKINAASVLELHALLQESNAEEQLGCYGKGETPQLQWEREGTRENSSSVNSTSGAITFFDT